MGHRAPYIASHMLEIFHIPGLIFTIFFSVKGVRSSHTTFKMTASNRSATNGHGQAIIDPRVATTPSAPERLAHLQKEIESHSQDYTNGNADARLKLLETARSLVQAMETPQETMLRYCWAQVRQNKDLSRGTENAYLMVTI